MPAETIWAAAAEVPPEWYGGDVAEMEALVEKLLARRAKIREGSRRSRIGSAPFPNWHRHLSFRPNGLACTPLASYHWLRNCIATQSKRRRGLAMSSGDQRRACEFHLLRYVSDAVRNEYVHIGVILREQPGGAEGARPEPALVRFTRDWRRCAAGRRPIRRCWKAWRASFACASSRAGRKPDAPAQRVAFPRRADDRSQSLPRRESAGGNGRADAALRGAAAQERVPGSAGGRPSRLACARSSNMPAYGT